MPRIVKRVIRALEVYRLTGRPLTDALRRHRVAAARIRGDRLALRDSRSRRPRSGSRAASTRSSTAGCSTRSARLLARGFRSPRTRSRGLVYRQALEHLHGVRDEAATRELIARENRRYARRQLIWFRKEPNLQWFYGAGERDETRTTSLRALEAREIRRDAPDT